MGLNVTHTMNSFNFENKESLKNTARDILTRQGATSEKVQAIVEKTIFDAFPKSNDAYINSQLAILKAASQISLNKDLKETLKYIKSQAHKKTTKNPVFGELWSLLKEEKEEYTGELNDFEIDQSAINIFIAA